MKTKFRTILILSLLFVIWLLILEGIATLSVRVFGNPLIQAKEVLDADITLGWRQKPSFRGVFQKIPLKTNELGLRDDKLAKLKSASKKVLILGPSSTFGWGVSREHTYSALLEKYLKDTNPSLSVEVINAGQIGFSSWQGLNFYQNEQLHLINADIVVIAYGVNDVDRFRFFYNSNLPDKDEFSRHSPSWKSSLLKLLNKSNLFNLSSYFTFKFLGKIICPSQFVFPRRVSPDDYIKNIAELSRLATANGSEVILLTTPYLLPKHSLSEDQKDAFDNVLSEGILDYSMKNFEKALGKFEQAAQLNDKSSTNYYYMSACLSSLGKCAESREYSKKAWQHESYRIAEDVDQQNRHLINFARIKNMTLANVSLNTNTLKENTDFVDPIHFSAQGNEKIARALFSIITQQEYLAK